MRWRSSRAGWVADTQTSVQSDVTKLVPSSMPALRDLHTLEHVTGVSGEIDVTVHARDVRDAERDRLDDRLREAAAQRTTATSSARAARKATLCPALSLPDLFSGGAQARQSRPRR